MSIKKIFLFIFLFFVSKNLIYTMVAPQLPDIQAQDKDMPPMPTPEEIENFIKDPEFIKMMEELDKIFAESEDDNKPVEKVEPKIEPESGKQEPKTGTGKKEEPKRSLKDEFLEPAKQDDKDKYSKDKLITKLPRQKVEAFNYYINKSTKSLNNIERKVNSFNLGIAFKEQMQDLGLIKLFNEIETAFAKIKSKRIYLKIFYLPMHTDLRQSILDTLKAIQKIEKDILNLKPLDKQQESEASDFEYLKKIAAKKTTKKSRLDLNLTPLQENIKKLLNSNLKNIKTKLNSIISSAQAKEEIEKKIGKRKQLEKDAESKAKPGRGYTPGYSRYPDYSRDRGYGGYDGYRPSRPNYPSTGSLPPSKQDVIKEPIKAPEPKKEPADKNLSSKVDEKTQKKLTKINNLSEDAIKLIQEIKTLYKDGTFKDIDKVYKSEKLSQLNDKISEINKNKKELNLAKETPKDKNTKQPVSQTSLTPKLDGELKGLIPLMIPLANNPGVDKESNSAQEILNYLEKSADQNIKIEFAKYEDKILNSLKNKERELKNFGAPAKEFGLIARNVEILNKLKAKPQYVDLDKIIEVNKKFKLALGDPDEFGELKTKIEEEITQANTIKTGIGKAVVPLRGVDQNLTTRAAVLTEIDQLQEPKVKEDLAKVTREVLNEPVPGVAVPIITENEKKDLKLKFSKIINNYNKQKVYLENIYNLVKNVEEEEED